MLLKSFYKSKNIDIIAVTKVICGNPILAHALINNGINVLADSRIDNIIKMHNSGIKATYLLLRSPALSQIEHVIDHIDISLNTELVVLKELSKQALKKKRKHKVILMVELGDLREGILPLKMDGMVKQVLTFKGLTLIGIGTNLTCLNGVNPSVDKMNELSFMANHLEKKFGIKLEIISGGNSSNYNWFKHTKDLGRINNLRIGESIFLGREPINKKAIPQLFTDVFTLITEVIESKIKPSKPNNKSTENSTDKFIQQKSKKFIQRTIIAIGLQDIQISDIIPKSDLTILGGSSDHIIVNNTNCVYKIGDTIEFDLNYTGLLSVFNSSYIIKNYINIPKN